MGWVTLLLFINSLVKFIINKFVKHEYTLYNHNICCHIAMWSELKLVLMGGGGEGCVSVVIA